MKRIAILALLLGSVLFVSAIPSGFHSIDEIINIITEAVSNRDQAPIKELLGDETRYTFIYNTMADTTRERLLKAGYSDQKIDESLKELLPDYETSAREYAVSVREDLDTLRVEMENFSRKCPKHKAEVVRELDYQPGVFESQMGVVYITDSAILFNTNTKIIECELPLMLYIDHGYALQAAPRLRASSMGFEATAFQSLILMAIEDSEFSCLEDAFITPRQMEYGDRIYESTYKKSEDYANYSDAKKEKFERYLEMTQKNT